MGVTRWLLTRQQQSQCHNAYVGPLKDQRTIAIVTISVGYLSEHRTCSKTAFSMWTLLASLSSLAASNCNASYSFKFRSSAEFFKSVALSLKTVGVEKILRRKMPFMCYKVLAVRKDFFRRTKIFWFWWCPICKIFLTLGLWGQNQSKKFLIVEKMLPILLF